MSDSKMVSVPRWAVEKIARAIAADRREGSRICFGDGEGADTWEDHLEAPKDAVEAVIAALTSANEL